MDTIKMPDHIVEYIVANIANPEIYKNIARMIYVMDISEMEKIEMAILVARFEVLYAISKNEPESKALLK